MGTKHTYNLNREILSDIKSIEDELQKEVGKVFDKYRDRISKAVAKKLPKGMSLRSVNGATFLYDKGVEIASCFRPHIEEGTSFSEHNYDILTDFAQYQYQLTLTDAYLIDSEIKGNK